MKVSELQQLLADVGRLFQAVGVGRQANELAEFTRSLAPYSDLTLAAFVKWAEDKPAPPPKPAGGTRPPAGRTPPPTDAEAEALAHEVAEMYAAAAQRRAGEDEIDELCRKLAPLSVPQLTRVAAGVDLKLGARPGKPKTLTDIRARIYDRAGATIRRAL